MPKLSKYIPARAGWLFGMVLIVVFISWRNDLQRFVYKHDRIVKYIRDIQYSPMFSDINDSGEEGAGILNLSTIRCPDTRRPAQEDLCLRPGRGGWQCYNHSSTALYVLRAFFDDRPLVPVPAIRIIAAVARMNGSDTFCQVWYEGLRAPFVVPIWFKTTGDNRYMVEQFAVKQYLIACVLPPVSARPTHVSIVTGRGPCSKSTIHVPIIYPQGKGKPYKHEFGLCVPISFGTILTVPLIEWIEIYQILGVTEFNIYNCTVLRTPELGRVLDYYQAKGILKLHELTPPSLTWRARGHGLATPGGINDCMMRNWYRYHRTIIIDLDEVIVPKLDLNLTALIKRIDVFKRRSEQTGYYFKNTYFHKTFQQDDSQPMYLRTMRMRRRWHPGGAIGKSILDPRKCLSAFNHFCYRPLGGAARGVNSPFTFASSHHYRGCSGKALCARRLNQTEPDDSILKFRDQLDSRVRDVMTKLNIKTPERIT